MYYFNLGAKGQQKNFLNIESESRVKTPQAVKCSLRGPPRAVKWQPMGTHSRPGGRRVNLL